MSWGWIRLTRLETDDGGLANGMVTDQCAFDFGSTDPALCFRLDGWLARVAALTGAPDIRVEHVQ